MKSAEFESVLDAAIYRKNHGGWLFIPESTATIAGRAFWFNASEFTPSTIMLHALTRGKSGSLVCDNRFLGRK